MAVSWNAVKEGDILYSRARQKMGNTTMSRMAEWRCRIVSIDHEAGRAIVSWNGNAPRDWSRWQVSKLFRNPMKRKQP